MGISSYDCVCMFLCGLEGDPGVTRRNTLRFLLGRHSGSLAWSLPPTGDQVASELQGSICLSLATMPGILCVCWESNSDSQAFEASTSLAGLSP